ncbi:hypothetical protein ONE63_006711 [Megalurothrips usitatus]|uniref:Reverse transcriptase domain-containing protein n=1 Tax=Megalurothrips usitatus TaxID=439358 RepID=A0AAV7XUA5_9NEOP|nr:hypothetical protein ONE63_006711 [Megalurothrips usitatus]
MLLYNITSSPLVRALDGRLQGLLLRDAKLVASAYVDDTVVLLRDQDDVPLLVETLQQFGEESGLHVNPAKSKALPVARWPRRALLPFPVVKEMTILGVTFTAKTSRLTAINWRRRIGALRSVLVSARLRAFNIIQRVAYLNTYALPLLWHLAQVTPLPPTTARDISGVMGKFLWAGKRVRVPFEVLILPKARGGLDLQDPLRKAAAMFVSRWISSQGSSTVTVSGEWLRSLREQHGNGEGRLPASVSHFREARRMLTAPGFPAGVDGRALTRALYSRAIEDVERTPRAMRGVSEVEEAVVWHRVHHKVLPVDVRATWFEAAHDVLPTAIRLQAANQAEAPDCPRCQEPEDVIHHLARCGPGRQEAWEWAASRVRAITGAAPSEDAIVRPSVDLPGGARDAATIWVLGTAVHFLATRREVTAAAAADFLERRKKGLAAGLRELL